MGGFLRIKPAVHRVAIAGKVIDALNSQPIAGAIASITASPGAFQRALAIHAQQRRAREDDASARPDRAVAAADGCFCFADLPDGAYTVSIAAPAGLRYGVVARAFTVKRDAEGNIAFFFSSRTSSSFCRIASIFACVRCAWGCCGPKGLVSMSSASSSLAWRYLL